MLPSLRIIQAAAATLLLLTGLACQAPPPPDAPTVRRVAADSPEQVERLFVAAADTLRDHYLEPDRQDRLQGVITTHPDTTANAFEIWRPQPDPAYYWWEANVHTIQRQTTVRIKPADGRDVYELDVQVDRFRHSIEERQIDNAAGALRLYSADAPTVSGLRERPSETAYWLPLGRDAFMEQRLVEAILHRYETAPPAEPETQPADTQP